MRCTTLFGGGRIVRGKELSGAITELKEGQPQAAEELRAGARRILSWSDTLPIENHNVAWIADRLVRDREARLHEFCDA